MAKLVFFEHVAYIYVYKGLNSKKYENTIYFKNGDLIIVFTKGR